MFSVLMLMTDQMKNFEKSLPGGFYDIANEKKKTMVDDQGGVKAKKKIILDQEVIYACTFALWNINPDLVFEKQLVSKLAP